MNNGMTRGEIRWVLEENNTGLGGKNRPAVIIREDRETATVVFLSSSERSLNEPERIFVSEALEPSAALCEKVTTLVKSKIGNVPIGMCSNKTLEQIVEGVRKAIGGKPAEENYREEYMKMKREAQLYRWMLERMEENSVDLIHTSIPFGNHYEYSPNYADFGHNPDDEQFFDQMRFLTPNLLKVLKPGRVMAVHVKDRVLFGNVTGTGFPTMEPFHAICIRHYMEHGFLYFGMITVVTDVVRENNQTYRLGWSEMCKDGTKMGVGCPEYILLLRKQQTEHGKGYADCPVRHSKKEYTRAKWQIDASGMWRSSGNRLIKSKELETVPTEKMGKIYREFSRENIYDYRAHVRLAEKLEAEGHLPSGFGVMQPGSWTPDVWDDVNRMITLNSSQKRKYLQMHVCPLQLDIVERIIERYSNPGEVVLDPFAGLFTVPYMAVKMGRRGIGVELSAEYFADGLQYMDAAEQEKMMPTLFDII